MIAGWGLEGSDRVVGWEQSNGGAAAGQKHA